jgi:hypothetical protein
MRDVPPIRVMPITAKVMVAGLMEKSFFNDFGILA